MTSKTLHTGPWLPMSAPVTDPAWPGTPVVAACEQCDGLQITHRVTGTYGEQLRARCGRCGWVRLIGVTALKTWRGRLREFA